MQLLITKVDSAAFLLAKCSVNAHSLKCVSTALKVHFGI